MGPANAADRRTAVALAGYKDDEPAARAGLADTDSAVRIAALRSLHRLAALADADIDTALNDAMAEVRIAALELAATRSSPPIRYLLDDEDSMVVESAAWALGEREDDDPLVLERLSEIAGAHDDPLAREAAVAALGAIGDDRGIPAVLAATKDKPAVRRRAVIALVAFEGPEVEAAWERARTDRDRQVREAVEELLGPEED